MVRDKSNGMWGKWALAAGVILVLAGLAVAYGFGKGVLSADMLAQSWRRLMSFHHALPAAARTAPAGLASAEAGDDELDLSGWAPPGAAVQILDHGKPVALASADRDGSWGVSYAVTPGHDAIDIVTILYQENGAASASMGRLSLWMPDSTAADSYIWWQDGKADALLIMQAPAPASNDLALTLALMAKGQAPLFAGSATAGRIVQVYADGQLAGTATAGRDGTWAIHALPVAGKANARLRFDDIRARGDIAERRAYRLDWGNAGGEAGLTRVEDGWIAAGKGEMIYILKPSAGTAQAARGLLPGEIMPLPLPAKSRPGG